MIAVSRIDNQTWIIYGSYVYWPSQCYWLVPAMGWLADDLGTA
jgi:hypothetical protein